MNAAERLRNVRQFIRQPYAWPGGYPLACIMDDGELLCARENYRAISHATRHSDRGGWLALAVEVQWEGPDNTCANCNCAMPTAYGDPEAP